METQLTLDLLKEVGFKPILNPFTNDETDVLDFEDLKIAMDGDDFINNKFTVIQGERFYKVQWLEVLVPLVKKLTGKEIDLKKHPI